MNDGDFDELMKADRFDKMPDCTWTCEGVIRLVYTPTNPGFYEMLYRDGWGKPFWGPIPSLRLP